MLTTNSYDNGIGLISNTVGVFASDANDDGELIDADDDADMTEEDSDKDDLEIEDDEDEV